MSIRITTADPNRLTDAALLAAIRDGIAAAKARARLLPELKALLAGEVEDLAIETLGRTPGGLDGLLASIASDAGGEVRS